MSSIPNARIKWNSDTTQAETALAKVLAEVKRLADRLDEAQEAEDQWRRILWIIAKRNGGTIRIAESDLVTAPHLPGLATITDAAAREIVITAIGEADQ